MRKEDSELVRAAQQGAGPEAQRAFADLVDRWQRPIHFFLLRMVHHHQDAEDVAADTFVRAWRNRTSLRDPGAFRAWLFRIAARQAASFLRGKGVKNHLHLVDHALLEEEASTPPLAVSGELKEAFAGLPGETLDLLRLKYEQNLSYRDIAARQGVSVSTIRDRLVQARGRVEGVLRKSGVLETYVREIERKKAIRAAARRGEGGREGSDG